MAGRALERYERNGIVVVLLDAGHAHLVTVGCPPTAVAVGGRPTVHAGQELFTSVCRTLDVVAEAWRSAR